MWIDDRGSEILRRNECLRLLHVAAGSVGHLGLVVNEQPFVFPVNFGVADGVIVLQIGRGTMLEVMRRRPIVAYEVDAGPDEKLEAWSVMVQGPADVVEDPAWLEKPHVWGPHPVVPEPGSSYVRIRPWVVTGRRFTATGPLSVRPATAAAAS